MKRLRKRPGVPGVPGVPVRKIPDIYKSDHVESSGAEVKGPLRAYTFLGSPGTPGTPSVSTRESLKERCSQGSSSDWEHRAHPPSAVAIAELLLVEVRHLAELPVQAALTLDVEGLAGAPGWPAGALGRITLTTSRARAQAAAESGEACCTPLEYEALSDALCGGYCTRAEALAELACKAQPLGHRLTLERLVGVHTGSPKGKQPGQAWVCPATQRTLLRAHVEPGRWTFADLCSALHARLIGVEVCES